jgi:hypothetical protein
VPYHYTKTKVLGAKKFQLEIGEIGESSRRELKNNSNFFVRDAM